MGSLKLFSPLREERWMRHADIPPDRWEVIVSFVKQHLPRFDFQRSSLPTQDCQMIVQGKKKWSSAGLDGVTLIDVLRSMLDHVAAIFCHMFQISERTGEWPMQLVEGKVVSLAKSSNPSSPADFRPITVFSLLYRVWSSYHARKALSKMDSILPDTLYGRRPGRYAGQIWTKMLWAIEHSFQVEADKTGLVDKPLT